MLPGTPDSVLDACCKICGKPLEPLLSLPAPPGGGAKTCEACGSKVCAAHYSNSRKRCVKCTAGQDTWCKIPVPPLP